MQTNEALIVNFFNAHRKNNNHFNDVEENFVFDVLKELANNPAVSGAYAFDRYSNIPHVHRRKNLNKDMKAKLMSLSGLDYAFILDGTLQSLNCSKDIARIVKHDVHHESANSFFSRGGKSNLVINKEQENYYKFKTKTSLLHNQLFTIISYMIDYYSYNLSIDYRPLLNQWLEAEPHLHITGQKEIKALEQIIQSTAKANHYFKERYLKFVDFVIDSNPFAEMMSISSNREEAAFERSYFGIHAQHQEQMMVPTVTDAKRRIFANQERLLTDFIEDNKDILISREAHEVFNQDTLVADYKKVLKICEILIEKTNVHMSYPSLKAVDFLSNYANQQIDILKLTDFTTDFKELEIVAILNNVKDSNITAAIIFDDSSVVVKKKGYDIFQYNANTFDAKELLIQGTIDEITHMLRKNPSISKAVKLLITNLKNKHVNNISQLFTMLRGLKVSIKSYFEHVNILKSHNFDFINELKTSHSFEIFDDKIHKIVRKHKIEQYANSIVSNKYKSLYSDKTYTLMEELYDLGLSTHILQDMIGKKMASIKNTRSLNAALKSLISSIDGFDIKNIKMKAAANNVKVLFETDNYLVLEIDTFRQSKIMGSPSWCISRDNYHFENYTNGGKIQVFAYDFTLTAKDNKSIVGLTLTKAMKVHAAHNKNDTELRDKAMKERLIKIVANAKGIVLKEHKPKAA